MFADNAVVLVEAGKGGDGAVSFRHEKYIDKGGPDGGDGGRGGNVIFCAKENVNTLAKFRHQPRLKAENGENGSKRKRRGKGGEHLIVEVPVGTVVLRDKEVLADLTFAGQTAIVARGGDGGFGNAHFKSSTRQAPRTAEVGEKGEAFEARLELKLLADVGLVGFPNAGKSTFLAHVTNAKPEIANYAFTTLTPNLGVADIDSHSLLIADIPGLIEGASEGKGLGDAFLKHIERTAVILHMIDVMSDDVAAQYRAIRAELAAFDPALAERQEVVALTKIELVDHDIVDFQLEQLSRVTKSPTFAISSHKGAHLKELLRGLYTTVAEVRASESSGEEDEEGLPVITLSGNAQKLAWHIEKEDDHYRVTGAKIEKFAARTNLDNPHSVSRLRDIMHKMGIWHGLVRAGAVGESVIFIGKGQSAPNLTLEEQWED